MKFDFGILRHWRPAAIVAAGMVVTGVAVRPLEASAWETVRARQPALRLESMKDALGQGVTIGLLGGFRAILADLFWIKTTAVWEESDLPATQTHIRLVTAIDPRPLYFWINGSRMIGYDMPNWRIDQAGGYYKVPESLRRKYDEEQTQVAVGFLNQAFGHHPDNVRIHIEIANLYLNRLKDLETAAHYYKIAAEKPDAPFYAVRIYAELLRRLGRNQEAYDWLVKIYPTLPKEGEAALYSMPEVVLERIRELEAELKIPPYRAYRPAL